ncbi:3-deoxy-7-phosphoheptulonate synthase [Bradyrhizobium sp. LM3.4]
MLSTTDDLRIRELKELSTPEEVMREVPRTLTATRVVMAARNAIHAILNGQDDRLLVVVGPCSVHDPRAALEYAEHLASLREELADQLEIVMRVYFEKPRTTVGWKGLINDPDLDGSFDINRGLRLARNVLSAVNNLGLPAGTEFLDMTTPQYIADLVSWAAIGARTTESQIHRELASGLSCPVGFKNGTDGNVRIAADAVKSASHPHHFMAVTKLGRSAIASTAGNEDCHIILRGGSKPNYDAASVAEACNELAKASVAPLVMVDASHANLEQEAGKPAACDGRHRRADFRRREPHHGGDDREQSRRRAPGRGTGQAAHLWPEHHGRMHRLGDHGNRARAARLRGRDPPQHQKRRTARAYSVGPEQTRAG